MSTFLHRNGTRKSLAAKLLSPPSLSKSSKGNLKRSVEEISKLQLGCYSLAGPKHVNGQNEDRAVCGIYPLNQPNQAIQNTILTAYAAVFDGHGGPQCSDYVAKVVATHLKENFCDDDSWINGIETMHEVFHSIDAEFTELATRLRNNSGSCATIVAIRDNELVVGNIGDCSAMMMPVSDKGSYLDPVIVTHDHRADGIAEEMRINEAGGKVKGGRVLCLQPSRSFGDLDCKQKEHEGLVIAKPDVDKLVVIESKGNKDRPFMVICSDGVWDVLNAKAVSTLAKNVLKKNEFDATLCAQKIVELAQEKGSDDDTTCVVIVW